MQCRKRNWLSIIVGHLLKAFGIRMRCNVYYRNRMCPSAWPFTWDESSFSRPRFDMKIEHLFWFGTMQIANYAKNCSWWSDSIFTWLPHRCWMHSRINHIATMASPASILRHCIILKSDCLFTTIYIPFLMAVCSVSQMPMAVLRRMTDQINEDDYWWQRGKCSTVQEMRIEDFSTSCPTDGSHYFFNVKHFDICLFYSTSSTISPFTINSTIWWMNIFISSFTSIPRANEYN